MTSQIAQAPRAMLDSNRPELIPADAEMVAGYVDGSWAWGADEWARFDGRPRVHITVEPFNRLGQPTGYRFGNYHEASVIDVEAGAYSPLDSARFVPQRDLYRPGSATVYVDEAGLGQALRANRGHGRPWWLWLAWYLGHAPSEADVAGILARLEGHNVRLAAWQWKPGPKFDLSAVYADSWHPSTSRG